ncbi:MAG: ABC transporter ATP-binding protein [Promethearchaeota archaeon]
MQTILPIDEKEIGQPRGEFASLFGIFFTKTKTENQQKNDEIPEKTRESTLKDKKNTSTTQSSRKHKDKELLGYLWKFVVPYKRKFVAICLLMLINIVLGILSPLSYQRSLKLIEENNQNPQLMQIFPFLLAYFLIILVKWFTDSMQRYVTIQLNSFITNSMRLKVFDEILQNSIQFYDHAESGVLTSNITNDIQELYETGERFVYVFTSLIRLIVTVGILLSFSPRMTLISMAFLPVFFLISISLRKFQRRVARIWRKNFGKVNQSFSESMRSITISKAFERENENVRRFTQLNELTYKSSVKRGFGIFIMGPVSDFLRHVLLVIILWIGTVEYNSGRLTIAAFSLFVFMFDYYFYPILGLARHYNRFQSLFGILERLLESSEQKDIKESTDYQLPALSLKGEIEFNRVYFAYTPEKPILQNISFKAFPGERIAIVGPTGAGKTTIASILMRFYSHQNGEILIDGEKIESYPLTALRKSIGLVSQRVLLIKGTIRDNLLLGNEGATDDEIWNALDMVQAREFIEMLPQGLDSKVSEKGKNLSSGQRQMLSFARVLLSNPQIIILDEATSAVDLYTEAKIQDAIDILLEGRTSLVIAHRLTTILKSDLIIVIDDGKILQQGTHEELMQQPGPYQNLYQLYFETQSAKYLERIKTGRKVLNQLK